MGWLHSGNGGRGYSRCVHGTQFWEDAYKECPHCRREADEQRAEWERRYREEREAERAAAQARAVPLTPDMEIEVSVYGSGDEGPTLLGWESPADFLGRHPEAVLYDGRVYTSRAVVLKEYGWETRSTRPAEPAPKAQGQPDGWTACFRIEKSRQGEPMIRHWNRPGFLDRSYTGPRPRPGEVWEVKVIGMNRSQTVYFWLPVRKVRDVADNPRWKKNNNKRR